MRRSIRNAVIAIALSVAAVPVVIVGGVRAMTARLDAELAGRIAAYQRGRWVRPVLRGEVIEGDAAGMQLGAVRKIGPVPFVAGLDWAMEHGSPLPADAIAAAHKVGTELDAVRRATHAEWVGFTVGGGLDPATVSAEVLGRTSDANKLLLVRARLESPAECLRICTDVIRGGQDLVPYEAGAYDPRNVASSSTVRAAPIAISCAIRADDRERAEAVRELEALVAQAPPVASSLEGVRLVWAFEEQRRLARAIEERDMTEVLSCLDATRGILAMKLLPPPTEIDAFAANVRRARADDATLREWAKGCVPGSHRADFRTVLVFDARSRAHLRALAVAIAGISDGPAGPLFRAALDAPAHADPFTGLPLHVRPMRVGAGFEVLSYGEDGAPGRDDAIVAVP